MMRCRVESDRPRCCCCSIVGRGVYTVLAVLYSIQYTVYCILYLRCSVFPLVLESTVSIMEGVAPSVSLIGPIWDLAGDLIKARADASVQIELSWDADITTRLLCILCPSASQSERTSEKGERSLRAERCPAPLSLSASLSASLSLSLSLILSLVRLGHLQRHHLISSHHISSHLSDFSLSLSLKHIL